MSEPTVDAVPEAAPDVWLLPDGQTIPKVVVLPAINGVRDHEERVTLRDPRSLRAGDRKAVIRAISSTGRLGAAVDIADGVLAMVIEHWTFTDLPLPRVAPGSLDLLEITDYDLLAEATSPVDELLFPKAAQNPPAPSSG